MARSTTGASTTAATRTRATSRHVAFRAIQKAGSEPSRPRSGWAMASPLSANTWMARWVNDGRRAVAAFDVGGGAADDSDMAGESTGELRLTGSPRPR